MISFSDYRQRADDGDEDALLIIGLLAALSVNHDNEIKNLEAPLSAAAELGNLYAQYVIGQALVPSFHPSKDEKYLTAKRSDLEQVISAYLIAAEANFLPAQEKLGFFYEILNDLENAIMWYERAADQGSVDGAVSLARIYDENTGSRPDSMRAEAYYKKAEELGHLPAIAATGEKLMTSGDPKVRTQGWKKLRKAVVEGNPWAYLRFSSVVMRGLVDMSDKKKFAKIFADMANAKLKKI